MALDAQLEAAVISCTGVSRPVIIAYAVIPRAGGGCTAATGLGDRPRWGTDQRGEGDVAEVRGGERKRARRSAERGRRRERATGAALGQQQLARRRRVFPGRCARDHDAPVRPGGRRDRTAQRDRPTVRRARESRLAGNVFRRDRRHQHAGAGGARGGGAPHDRARPGAMGGRIAGEHHVRRARPRTIVEDRRLGPLRRGPHRFRACRPFCTGRRHGQHSERNRADRHEQSGRLHELPALGKDGCGHGAGRHGPDMYYARGQSCCGDTDHSSECRSPTPRNPGQITRLGFVVGPTEI